MTVRLYEGRTDLEVVGESFHQQELRVLVGRALERVRFPQHAIVVPETGNPHDEAAVSVWIAGAPVGHLRREDAAALRPGIINLVRQTGQAVALDAVIVGGGARENGRPGLLGVWLSYDPADFGLESGDDTEPSAGSGLRTGLSEALTTDEADDSYDLSWFDALPDQPSRRVPRLRELLQVETEPISRHYLFRALEADLYAMRDLHPGMLEEYDGVTATHDREMAVIRSALVQKFGDLPLLETYKQAAIRHSKAARLDVALRWAQRGVDLYGSDAHNEAWVDDLRRRAAVLETRIELQHAPRPTTARVTHASTTPPTASTETLICQTCGRSFERVRTRGRKPHQCSDCRGA